MDRPQAGGYNVYEIALVPRSQETSRSLSELAAAPARRRVTASTLSSRQPAGSQMVDWRNSWKDRSPQRSAGYELKGIELHGHPSRTSNARPTSPTDYSVLQLGAQIWICRRKD